MIRAEAILKDAQQERVRALAQAWSAAPSPAAVAAAMRGPEAAKRALAACSTPVMREDLLLLCANPFDPVAYDEVVDAPPFVAIGLLEETEPATLHVNVDIALAAVRSLPLEFGFAATLVARLSDDERTALGRAVEIGPRPSVIEALLDIAASIADPDALMRRVARLTDSQREIVRTALSLGELPDDLDAFPLDAAPPTVTVAEGAAGKLGLVFQYEHLPSGVRSRPVVPLELAEVLPGILEQVPPPPETVAAKARRRPTRRAPRKKKTSTESMEQSGSGAQVRSGASSVFPGDSVNFRSRPADSVMRRAADPSKSGAHPNDTLTQSGGMSALRDSLATSAAMTASGAMTPYRLGRVKSVRPASAIVDVETAKVAEAVLRDTTLAGDVLEVKAESLVILRAGVDARAWAERCALRLGL